MVTCPVAISTSSNSPAGDSSSTVEIHVNEANINEVQLKDLSKNVNFDSKAVDEQGAEKDSDSVFIASFIIGLMIYITLAIYGQMILSAVVEINCKSPRAAAYDLTSA